MDGTPLVLFIVFAAILAYVLYWVVRKAVAHGIRDARVEALRGDRVP